MPALPDERNPKLFREMSEPFDTDVAAQEAMEAFFADVAAAREKHRMANVYVIVNGNMVDAEGETEFMNAYQLGYALKGEMMTAWAYGREQGQREELIRRIVANSMKPRRR